MGDNETGMKEANDTEQKSHGCLIAFLVFFLIFVAPILIFCLLLFYACHKAPDLSDYHQKGETIVLSGEKFDYQITYKSYGEYFIELSITIDEEIERPDILYFYTCAGSASISYVYSNKNKYEAIRTTPGWFIYMGKIAVPMETNPCEVKVFQDIFEDFKGYIKFELTDVPGDDESEGNKEAIKINFY